MPSLVEPVATAPAACCAVVINYRTPELTIRCVDALLRDNTTLPIVIIDNASGDQSVARLTDWVRERDTVRVEALDQNIGFGGACNIGFALAIEQSPDLRWVLVLNPDTVPQPGMLAALRDSAEAHPEAGIVGGRVLSGDGRSVWYENGRFRPWTLGKSHAPAPAGTEDFETEFVTGALMLVDAGLLREGLHFDERFFLYVEDLDLCREVRRRGRTLRVALRAVATHEEGASQAGERAERAGMRARQLFYITRNKVLFARKRLPFFQRLAFYATALFFKPLAGVVRYGKADFLGTYYGALIAGLQGRGGPMP